jgi:hypothetical protein
VSKQPKDKTRKGVSLDVSDFKLFVEERKKLLAKRLKKIIEGV